LVMDFGRLRKVKKRVRILTASDVSFYNAIPCLGDTDIRSKGNMSLALKQEQRTTDDSLYHCW